MKKLGLLLVGIFMLNMTVVLADEGMWLLSLLGKNYEQMKKQGFKLTPDDIYNVNKGCLKDAVVGLGNAGSPFWHYCTGEIISDQGLFSTNHHCGYGSIQSHSSIEHDYLTDGFWAKSMAEELPNEGMTAAILVRMEDVTNEIVPHLSETMTEKERNKMIDSLSKIITTKATEGTLYEAQVADMFAKNQFFMLVYIIYEDVRLVGAPPSSMGKFGGDTDNWEWPRHTADFSMFRIYTDKNGNPAPFSKDNVPLKPKHFFPISVKGIQDGDFAMVMGFPGTTERFLTSYGLQETMDITNKLRYEIRTVKINILRDEMAADPQVRIQYASKYASCSNYWKYSFQQNKALKALNTMAIKQQEEAKYLQWAENQSNPKYKDALNLIQKGYQDRAETEKALSYIIEGIITGPEILYFAYRKVSEILSLSRIDSQDTVEMMKAELLKEIDDFYKDFNPDVEKKLLANLLEYTYKNLDYTYHPAFFTNIFYKKFKTNGEKYANYIMSKSVFASAEKLKATLNDKNVGKILLADPAFVAGVSALRKYRELYLKNATFEEGIEEGSRYFVDGILKINKDKNYAPDANSTIRLTYGNVGQYDPRDGVTYHYYTTLEGVMQKEDPTNSEFIVPQRLKDLYAKKDFGQYADKNGNLPVNFITNNDITGGNSGSPVIDGEGNLIGLAFDGNSEAMSGDIDFEENLQRCINLDVRYMLFIIDKYAGASNLIKEIKIVK
ncbi:MAG: S46 family peptidase [Bacteroidales bacterium]|jgi:hypothetical protein|nr:S46 family peptidase [Bacteroidales bacterium]